MPQRGHKIERVAVFGLGLIGGSIAAGIRSRKLATHVTGYALGQDRADALALGLVDSVGATPAQTAAGADIIFVATPVPTIASVLAQIVDHIGPDTVVTDCASTKDSTVQAARQKLGDAFARFVPGHPISGSEFSGPAAAKPDQFENKLWLLAPVPETDDRALARVTALLTAMGARCGLIDSAEHDALFAEYSHAPHALVYAICDAVAKGPNAARLSELAGAGFKDTTRIGATSPRLWTDILLDNRRNVLAAMDRYVDAMIEMRGLLEAQDRDGLLKLLDRAATWRQGMEADR